MNTLSTFFSSFARRLRSGAHQDPVRDWLVLFILSLLALVCIIVWNIWAFDTVAQGGSIGTAATSTPPVFNRSSIDTINKVFDTRAGEEAKYVTGVYRYGDPSQ
jgi:hypothetical protein